MPDIEIVHDSDLQALARTRDEWSLRKRADLILELDDGDDAVNIVLIGVAAGVKLANMVVANGQVDCRIFEITLDQYGDDNVFSYWVGTAAAVRDRLNGVAADPRCD